MHLVAVKWIGRFSLTRGSLVAVFSRSIVSEIIQTVLALANSILIVRALGSTATGHYFLLTAFLGPYPAILNSFDQVLTRFLVVSDDELRRKLVTGVFLAKLYGGLLCFGILILLWIGGVVPLGLSQLTADYGGALIVAALANSFLLPLVIGWSGRTLTGYKQYDFQIGTDLLQAFATTIWIGTVCMTPGWRRLDVLLVGCAVIAATTAILKAIRVVSLEPTLAATIFSDVVRPGRSLGVLLETPHRQYVGPFFLMSISGYLKDLFPLLVVGTFAPPSTVTVFRIVQQLFRVAHKLVPNAFEVIRPRLLAYTANPEAQAGFAARYQQYATIYLCMAALFSLFCVHALAPILSVWAIQPSPLAYAVATVCAVEFIFLSAAHIDYQVVLLQTSTAYVAIQSLTRQIVSVLVMIWAGHNFGLLGVAAGTALGAFLSWFGFLVYVSHHRLRPPALQWRTVVVLVSVCLTLILTSIPRWAALLHCPELSSTSWADGRCWQL
jgi:O-antigen/teichoic acid export membrane protein